MTMDAGDSDTAEGRNEIPEEDFGGKLNCLLLCTQR